MTLPKTCFAIKTAKGYLATQGDTYWFQDEPDGWALFATEEAARDVAEPHHSAIGTKPEEGYTIEELRFDTLEPIEQKMIAERSVGRKTIRHRMKVCGPQMWTYRGVDVFPADRNSSGIRWYARTASGMLRTDTKEMMRSSIRKLAVASR